MVLIRNTDISQEAVLERYEYVDGELLFKIQIGNKKPGDEAGCLNKVKNRYTISVNNKPFFRSRLVFLYHYGYLPDYVDHIDGDTTNDRIENLREANNSQNQGNRIPKRQSSSKYLGVSHEKGRYWTAKICINNKRTYLGTFATEIEAAAAYNEAAKEHFKEFATLNKIEQWSIIE